MDETDAEAFDKFIEKHWPEKLKQTVLVGSMVDEQVGTKKGRKTKA